MGDIERLNACLNELGDWNLNSLSNRKILQKKIYFLQQFGLDLGYSFGFYVYGPYSPELTDDAYHLRRTMDKAAETIQEYEFPEHEQEIIDKTREFLDEITTNITSETAHEIEVLASLHFLCNFSHIVQKSKQKIFAKLTALKGFEQEEMNEAWESLEEHDLIELNN